MAESKLGIAAMEETMNVTKRVERLREHLVRTGERPQAEGVGKIATHADFGDFSEGIGEGDLKPDLRTVPTGPG